MSSDVGGDEPVIEHEWTREELEDMLRDGAGRLGLSVEDVILAYKQDNLPDTPAALDAAMAIWLLGF